MAVKGGPGQRSPRRRLKQRQERGYVEARSPPASNRDCFIEEDAYLGYDCPESATWPSPCIVTPSLASHLLRASPSALNTNQKAKVALPLAPEDEPRAVLPYPRVCGTARQSKGHVLR